MQSLNFSSLHFWQLGPICCIVADQENFIGLVNIQLEDNSLKFMQLIDSVTRYSN